MEIIAAIVLMAALVHLLRLGTYYIEFDGNRYWTWRRRLLGFNECAGLDYTEAGAKKRIDRLKQNPPRRITP